MLEIPPENLIFKACASALDAFAVHHSLARLSVDFPFTKMCGMGESAARKRSQQKSDEGINVNLYDV